MMSNSPHSFSLHLTFFKALFKNKAALPGKRSLLLLCFSLLFGSCLSPHHTGIAAHACIAQSVPYTGCTLLFELWKLGVGRIIIPKYWGPEGLSGLPKVKS